MVKSMREPEIRPQVQEFGGLWLAHMIDQEIDFAGIVDSVVTRGQKRNRAIGRRIFPFRRFQPHGRFMLQKGFPSVVQGFSR